MVHKSRNFAYGQWTISISEDALAMPTTEMIEELVKDGRITIHRGKTKIRASTALIRMNEWVTVLLHCMMTYVEGYNRQIDAMQELQDEVARLSDTNEDLRKRNGELSNELNNAQERVDILSNELQAERERNVAIDNKLADAGKERATLVGQNTTLRNRLNMANDKISSFRQTEEGAHTAGFPYAAPYQPALELPLCDQEKVILKPGRPYIFMVHEDCEHCRQLQLMGMGKQEVEYTAPVAEPMPPFTEKAIEDIEALQRDALRWRIYNRPSIMLHEVRDVTYRESVANRHPVRMGDRLIGYQLNFGQVFDTKEEAIDDIINKESAQ